MFFAFHSIFVKLIKKIYYEGYEFFKIADVMLRSVNRLQIVTDWADLAAALDIRQVIPRLERGLANDMSDHKLVITILETWRCRKGTEATFNKLLDVLYDSLTWTGVAGK